MVFLSMTAMSCTAQSVEKEQKTIQETSKTIDNEPRLTLTDFTDVAAATIDGVVHIKTEMTQLTPMYMSFYGFII